MANPDLSDFHPESLSSRERAVLDLATDGATDAQIAERMKVSVSTVNSYWVRIRAKLGPLSRTDLVGRTLRQELCRRTAELQAETLRLRKKVGCLTTEIQETRALNPVLNQEAWHFCALAYLPEAAIVTGPPAIVVYANHRAYRLYRAESGTLEGLEMRDLTKRQTPETMREPCREMLVPNGPERETHGLHEPYYAQRRDGTNFRAILQAQRFDTPSGPYVALTIREFLEDARAVFQAMRKPLAFS